MAITANMTGYQFSSTKDVIKYEMEVDLREMDCYVAPTFINLENPTFWVNQGNIAVPRPFREPNKNSGNFGGTNRGDYYQ